MNILCVGCTGMLMPAVQTLYNERNRLILIARNEMDGVLERDSERIQFLSLDYCNALFLEDCNSMFGQTTINKAILWMHTKALSNKSKLIESLIETNVNVEIFDIWGSQNTEELRDIPEIKDLLRRPQYYQVILGKKIHSGQYRWLTHQEISDGVLSAMNKKERITVVGML